MATAPTRVLSARAERDRDGFSARLGMLQALGNHAQGKCLRIRTRLLGGVTASRRLMGS